VSAVCTAALSSGHARPLLLFWVWFLQDFFEQQHSDGLNVSLFSITKKIIYFVFSVGVCLSVGNHGDYKNYSKNVAREI